MSEVVVMVCEKTQEKMETRQESFVTVVKVTDFYSRFRAGTGCFYVKKCLLVIPQV